MHFAQLFWAHTMRTTLDFAAYSARLVQCGEDAIRIYELSFWKVQSPSWGHGWQKEEEVVTSRSCDVISRTRLKSQVHLKNF